MKRFAPILALLALTAAPAAAAAPSPFDRPLKTVKVPLPKDADNPQARPRVTCTYFARYMVKEVDLGELGAEQLSIVPMPRGRAGLACRRDNAAAERVVSPHDWTGYFDGARGDFVVFTAEDGWNGGMGFAVVDARTGAKLFGDALKGQFQALTAGPDRLTLRYRRVYLAKCSLRADVSACWRTIGLDTGLSGRPPDCAAAYAREARRTPAYARQVRDDPTVIDYDVETVIEGGRTTLRPATGRAAACRPSE